MGYDVKRAFQSLSWLVGDPGFGSLYPALHALLRDGLVTVGVLPRQDKPPRKVYSIMKAGKQQLAEWAHEPQASNASLKAFVIRFNLAGNLSQAGLVAHLKQRRAQVATHRDILKQTTESLDEGADLGQRLTPNYGQALATAELDWLDSTPDLLSQPALGIQVSPGDSCA